ncbi:hypothetical protein F4803DRAFT_554392 [Xylaria telfairii]|nr:hypothetical protein F4803DRAFT_554392 [Xylaria telfairii]
MENPDVILDPNGEILVILRNSSSMFNSDEESALQEPLQEPASDSETRTSAELNSHESSELSDVSNDRVYRCSLRHLSLSCPRVERMMDGPWREARKIHEDNLHHWVVEGFDVQAMTIVLSLIHHKYSLVPKTVDLDLLVEIARIVDYIGCSEVVKDRASSVWIPALKDSIPRSYGAELMLWICVSGVFCEERIFRNCTRVAIRESHSGIPTLGLPILPEIAGEIDRCKERLLDQIFDAIDSFIEELSTTLVCNMRCDSMRLGVFLKNIHASSLSPRPRKPYTKFSVRCAIRALHCLPPLSIRHNDAAYESWVRGWTGFIKAYPPKRGYSSMWGSMNEDVDEKEMRRQLRFPLHCGFRHFLTTIHSFEFDLDGLDIKDLKT